MIQVHIIIARDIKNTTHEDNKHLGYKCSKSNNIQERSVKWQIKIQDIHILIISKCKIA